MSGPTDFRSVHGLHLLYAIAEHSCQVLAMRQAAGALGLQMGGSGGPDGELQMGSRGVNKAEQIKGRGVAHSREVKEGLKT